MWPVRPRDPVAYLGFQKGGHIFSGHHSAHKRGQTMFSFFNFAKTDFSLAKGMAQSRHWSDHSQRASLVTQSSLKCMYGLHWQQVVLMMQWYYFAFLTHRKSVQVQVVTINKCRCAQTTTNMLC